MVNKFNIRDLVDIICEWERKDALLISEKDKWKINGLCDTTERIIYLDLKLNYHEKRRTLIHECLHAYYDIRKIKRNETQVKKETEEILRRIYPENDTNKKY